MRREAILIQRINWPRMIDSTIAPLGFDCCALGAYRRLLQHNRRYSGRAGKFGVPRFTPSPSEMRPVEIPGLR
jgi:hypothetical protein